MNYREAADALRKNPEQWAAYEADESAVILAGPGSGKTKTLTVKVARLLDEVIRFPQKLACLTYNTECVAELKERFFDLEVSDDHNLVVSTVHSFCMEHILSKFGSLLDASIPVPLKVATTREMDTYMGQALDVVFGAKKPGGARMKANLVRRTCLDRQSEDWKEFYAAEATVVETYERLLRENGCVDFDDIILLSLRLVEQSAQLRKILAARFPLLVIDEYQDLGLPLHRMVLALAASGVRILAVGDPHQSIYGFLGAKPELIQELAALPNTNVFELKINYRSGSKIIQCAESLLPERKNYKGHQSSPGLVQLHPVEGGLEKQAMEIAKSIIPSILSNRQARNYGEVAVLYLDKNDGDAIAAACVTANVPFVRSDKGAPYKRSRFNRWLEDCANWCLGGWRKGYPRLSELVRAYLAFMPSVEDQAGKDDLKQQLVAFLFGHRDGALPLREWLSKFRDSCLTYLLQEEPQAREEAESFVALYGETLRGKQLEALTVKDFGGMAGSPDYVKLITIHGAKGQEFDAVVMMGMEQGRLPKVGASADLNADRNLFYVGLTRARNAVHITYSGWFIEWDKKKSLGRSSFVDQIAKFATS